MSDPRRVHCTFCKQTFVTSDTEECPLCRKTGGLVDPARRVSHGPNPIEEPLTKEEEEQERYRQQKEAAGGEYPVSRVCPQCGCAEFKKRRPEKLVAFTWDRVCKACDTHYTPPTPVWASIVFIVIGLLLAGLFGIGMIANLARGNVLGLPALVLDGLLAVVGVFAMIHGVRSLIGQRSVSSPVEEAAIIDPNAQTQESN